jgi:hypothetical protein
LKTNFNGRAQKIFSIKETIFAGFASLLTPVGEQSSLRGTAQGRTASHPQTVSGRAKIHFPHTPFSFCPLREQTTTIISNQSNYQKSYL